MDLLKVDEKFYFVKIVAFTFLVSILLILSVYYLLNSTLGVQQSFFEYFKGLIYSQKTGFAMLPDLALIFKILNIKLAMSLTLLSYILFSSSLSFLFYKILAKKYMYKDLSFKQALKKNIEWHLYKYNKTFIPLLLFISATAIFILLVINFFNEIVTFGGINTSLVTFISAFILLNILFLLALAVLFCLWKLLTLSFGSEIAVSEPELANETIMLRSKRLLSTKIDNIKLLSICLIFSFIFIFELSHIDPLAFSSVFFLNIVSYMGIKYLKTSSYLNNLSSYYQQVKSGI